MKGVIINEFKINSKEWEFGLTYKSCLILIKKSFLGKINFEIVIFLECVVKSSEKF